MQVQISSMTQKGQITIPLFIRKKLSLKKGEKLSFILEKDYIKIFPSNSFFSYRGALSSKKPFDIKKMREAVKRGLKKRYAKSP